MNSDAESARLEAEATRTDRDKVITGIREGLADVEAGRVKPARSALKALEKKYGVGRVAPASGTAGPT